MNKYEKAFKRILNDEWVSADCDDIQELVERATPKKVIDYMYILGFEKGYCPNCELLVDKRNNFCPNCGQALDWKD